MTSHFSLIKFLFTIIFSLVVKNKMLQALQAEEQRFNGKITEMYDLINDLETKDIKPTGTSTEGAIQTVIGSDWSYIYTQNDWKKYALLEKDYFHGLVNYQTSTEEWWIYIPQRPYTFSYIGFKAFKPIPYEYAPSTPHKIFYTCDICSSTTKRVAFDESNLTDGVDYSPINQVPIIRFKIYSPRDKRFFSLQEVSKYYINLVLELEFNVRE